jgi:hypothetical protein
MAQMGCASTKLTRTGFLKDYDSLQPAREKTVGFIPDEILAFKQTNVPWRSYTRIWIDPVTVQLSDTHPVLAKQARDDLARDFEERLRSRLEDRFEIVDHAGPDTLHLRSAITGVDPENVAVNIVAVIVLVPVDMGGISGEMEVRDSQSDEVLFAMTARRDGTPFLLLECFSRYGHARHGMKKWARLLDECLTDPALPPAPFHMTSGNTPSPSSL